MNNSERPTLLSSCARAATAAEARFRIDYPNARLRQSRIVALDPEAASILRGLVAAPWNGARFFMLSATAESDVLLTDDGGASSYLSDELIGANLLVSVTVEGAAVDTLATERMALFASERAIMTAGLVIVGDDADAGKAGRVLRPYCKVLAIARGEDYVPAMLSALRA